MAYFQTDYFDDASIDPIWTETTTAGGAFVESGGVLTVTSGSGLSWTYPPWTGDLSTLNWLHQDNISGDFSIVLKLNSITTWPEWDGWPDQEDTKRGLVVKVSNDTFAMLYISDYLTTVTNGWNIGSHHVDGGVHNSHGSQILDVFPSWGETYPIYFRIARVNGLFRSFLSVDGLTWYEFPHTVPLNDSSNVGIGIFASHVVTSCSMEIEYVAVTTPPGYLVNTLPVILSLKDPDLLNVVEVGGIFYPTARVKVQDLDTGTEYEIGDITSFSVSMSGEQKADSFSISCKDVDTWYKRGATNPDVFTAWVNRRIKIELGYEVEGVSKYVPVFIGVPRKDSISVTDEDEVLHISGEGLERALLLTDGSFGVYNGSAHELIGTILEAADLTDYWLGFADYWIQAVSEGRERIRRAEGEGVDITFTNAYGALTSIIKPAGNLEYFFDPEGTFIVQEFGTIEETVYTLSGELHLTSVTRTTDASQIITYVDVTGADDTATAWVQANAAIVAKYGINKQVYSSSILLTYDEAANYGGNIIEESLMWEDAVNITAPFIPYLRPGSKVVVTDEISELNAATVRVKSLQIRFDAQQGTSTTSITGFVE